MTNRPCRVHPSCADTTRCYLASTCGPATDTDTVINQITADSTTEETTEILNLADLLVMWRRHINSHPNDLPGVTADIAQTLIHTAPKQPQTLARARRRVVNR